MWRLFNEKINNKIKKFNFYQKLIFINILANQLKFLTNHDFFNIKSLSQYFKKKPDLKNIRKLMIENLIILTNNFTSNSYNSIIKEQNKVLDENIKKEEEEKKKMEKKSFLKIIIT